MEIDDPPTLSEPTFSFGGYALEHPELPPTAGFGIRLAARLIDFAVHWVVAIAMGLFFGFVLLIAYHGDAFGLQEALASLRQTSVIAWLLAAIGYAMYHTICEGWHGSSVGKLALGLVVLDEKAQSCRFTSALGRSFSFYVDSLVFGLIGYLAMKGSPLDQRNGDAWCHTIVARRRATPAAALRSAGRFAVVVLLALAVDAAFFLLGLLAHIQHWG